MKCYNCNNTIPKNNNIYKGYDNNFCNSTCRLNIINELNYIDPGNNNPQLWPQILIKIDSPLKKTKSINNIINLELNNNIKNNEKHYYRSCCNIINFENKFNLLKYLWTILFIFYYSK